MQIKLFLGWICPNTPSFSQNLKLFKLTEIWYRGTLLYAYFDFKVYKSEAL